MKKEPLVVIITGPTGIGKTALSLQLAQYFHTEIISADSRQCYREMTIGTAQPSKEELSSVKHHFINSHSIHQTVTAFDFELYALKALDGIFAKNKIAIVCGGTGLYLKALCEGLDEMPMVDSTIAASLNQEYLKKGKEWLKKTVATEDPQFYNQAEKENPARLLRALIFFRSTGQSIVTFKAHEPKERPFRTLKIALTLPRPLIYNQINSRVDNMMEAGLLDEAENLFSFRHLKPLNTVGYTELFDYLLGLRELSESISLIKQHSRNYAKRQLTWFRKDSEFHWFSPTNEKEILALIMQAHKEEIE